jgi:hypothetical protein
MGDFNVEQEEILSILKNILTPEEDKFSQIQKFSMDASVYKISFQN